MTLRPLVLAVALAATGLALPALAAPAAPAKAATQSSKGARLSAMYEQYWEELLKLNPLQATFQGDLAKVSVVGVGMRVHTGVAQRMFKALADAGVNIQNITTSEIKISCIIDKENGPKALQIVHDAFELGNTK